MPVHIIASQLRLELQLADCLQEQPALVHHSLFVDYQFDIRDHLAFNLVLVPWQQAFQTKLELAIRPSMSLNVAECY